MIAKEPLLNSGDDGVKFKQEKVPIRTPFPYSDTLLRLNCTSTVFYHHIVSATFNNTG